MITPSRLVTLTLALLLCAAAPAAAAGRHRPLHMLKKDVQIFSNRYVIAFNSGIPARMAKFYRPNAVLILPGLPTVRGRRAIVSAYSLIFADSPRLHAKTESIRRDRSGRFVQTGSYRVVSTMDGRRVTTRGRFRLVWLRVGKRFVLLRDEAITPRRTPRSETQKMRDVRVELSRFVIAFNRRVPAQVGRFYSVNASLKLPGVPRVRGRPAIVTTLRGMYKSGVMSLRVKDVTVMRRTDGHYVTRGHYTKRSRMAGKVRVMTGRFRIVWRFAGRRPVIVEEVTDL